MRSSCKEKTKSSFDMAYLPTPALVMGLNPICTHVHSRCTVLQVDETIQRIDSLH